MVYVCFVAEFGCVVFDDDDDEDEEDDEEEAPTITKRRTRRRPSTDDDSGGGGATVGSGGGRQRQSRTVDRLVLMGFKREDAVASVAKCGDDSEACMVWIVSHLEEQKFVSDLNRASIESELAKREEEKQLKKVSFLYVT